MKYRNKKTGAIIDSPCVISGGDWVEEKEELLKYSLEELEKMKLDKLKELAKKLELAVSGTKDELAEKINQAFLGQDEPGDLEDDTEDNEKE